MLGLAILLGFNLLGFVVKNLFSFPLPANVMGLILFILALFGKVVKLEWVEDSAQFLLKHMMVFFAPIIVGAMVFFPLIGRQWLLLIVSLVGSALVVLLVTGWVTTLLLIREKTEMAKAEMEKTDL